MADKDIQEINKNYNDFWTQKKNVRVYPNEFVLRIFLANYPGLKFQKPTSGDRILDVGFGDGRNAILLSDMGLNVSGVEITKGIVDQTKKRFENLGVNLDLVIGRNSSLPYENSIFKYILSCHCCYYCDDGDDFNNNMNEYSRVLEPNGWLVASLAKDDSYIFNGAIKQTDGTYIIKKDPYKNRNEYRLHAFSTEQNVLDVMSQWYKNISIGVSHCNFFGIDERVYWVTCQKK